MNVDSSPRMRKRARSLHQQLNSSSPVAGANLNSAVKRRKLDSNGSSPSTPKALQALKTAIGGVFKFGKKKEIANSNDALETASQVSKDTDGATARFDEFIDEILAEESQDRDVSNDNHDLESRRVEDEKQLETGEQELHEPTRRRKGRKSKGSIETASLSTADDVDELLKGHNHQNDISGNRPQKNLEDQQVVPEEEGEMASKLQSVRKRRRSRSSAIVGDAETAEDELSAATEPFEAISSRKAWAKVGADSAHTFTNQNLQWHTKSATVELASPGSNDGVMDVSINGEQMSGSASRPSRERRRPRRYSNEMLQDMKSRAKDDASSNKILDTGSISMSNNKPESVNTSPPMKTRDREVKSTPNKELDLSSLSTPNKKAEPKSILTPSTRTRGRPRKSVTFGVESPASDVQDVTIQDAHITKMEETSVLAKKKRGRPKTIRDPEPASADSTSQVKEILGISAIVRKDENRRSPRQKADADTPQNSRLSRGPESPIATTSLLGEEMPSREQSIGSTRTTPNASNPETVERHGRAEFSATMKALAAEEKSGSESDDITCVICGSGDSEPPNEILLCDNCDLAAHQLCYGVEVIPSGDWLCRDCRPDEDEELMLVDSEVVSEPFIVTEASEIPDIEGFEYHMQVMQKLVLDKLTGQRRLKLYGLDEEYRKVHQVVEQTVLAGEGNSMLVIGARGSGKTALVESVMSDLLKGHREYFHVVRLNGFIHTDDKVALREVWRQLGREMEVDDEVTSKTNNYADTLASLLAVLSHPSEIAEVATNVTTKSVIFILDEFDLFTSHPRQTLLYNLFDIAQARKAPVAVLGLTTKIDVVERLEKRVKSRFSHRYVHLPLPKNLGIYWEICRQGLLADEEEVENEGFTIGLGGQDEFREFWESMINDLYNEDEVFKQQLQTQYYRSKSVSAFLTSCILPIANLSPNSIPLTGESFFFTQPTLAPPDSKLHLLQSLAELDLALLIAATRLNVILDTENCNFAMAYDEYCGLTSKHKIQTSSTGVAALGAATKVWGREVALGAWERLVECELLISAGLGGAGNLGRDGGKEVKMYKVDVALDEIPGSVDGLSSIMAKWCREI